MHATPRSSRRRGSVLLVSLIFAAVIALSLGSFLSLANTATRTSYRTYYLGVAMNVAESGLEQAMWSINRAASGATAWAGWNYNAGANTATRTFDLGTVEGGATARVKVYAYSGSSNPYILARSIITPPTGSPIEKWIKVTLRRRSYFSVGAVGRDGVTFSGNNPSVSSWNSDPDNNPLTPYIPWSAAVNNDKGSIATARINATAAVNNADIYGIAAVGGSSSSLVDVGSNGSVGPFAMNPRGKDENSILTDFAIDLPDVSVPSATYTAIGAINGDTTLPRPGDTANSDGVYYYRATEISLNNKVLTISPGADVVIHVDNNITAVDVGGGSGAININGTRNPTTGAITSASLKIYTPGKITIGGQGSANQVTSTTTVDQVITTPGTTTTYTVPVYGKGRFKDTIVGTSTVTVTTPATTTVIPAGTTTTQVGQPIAFQIYGTRSTAQAALTGNQIINISGNGILSGVIYAPNADISAKGGGNSGAVYGSLVGASLKFTGNDAFYYDESLANLTDDNPLGIDNWNELVSYADRNTYATLMNF